MTTMPMEQTGPSPLDANDLLDRLRPVLVRLEEDLLERSADPGVRAALAAEHAREIAVRRTADPLPVWTRFRVTQIAAAWVLSLLFVRTLEDRGLVPLRLKASDDHRAQLRALAPYLGDRDYLLLIFRELCHYRGVRDVFDAAHNPVWTLGPSQELASELLAFARAESGLGGLDFSGDTRFLGDVYERLDEGVRKRYALLQTPDFVEEFILDRTLSPALEERGVEGLTLVDPTCGSGHFMLGAFWRLLAAWEGKEPGAGPEVWAFKAIHQVYGADINPYAVAIARFRLVLAYTDAAGLTDLDQAGDLRLNIAVADSLLPVEGAAQQELAAVASAEARASWKASPFAFAQGPEAQRVLGGRRFDVVVGNPPYITVKDEVLRDEYRSRYASASGQYQLVVPFVERFFKLARASGYVGAIVGNGFMKRSFGKKLIEKHLPTVDLTQIVDTSGAYIPGHGTPTVILFGRARCPTSKTVLAVMGKRGEPTPPEDPAQGLVWTSIRENASVVGYENEFVSVDKLGRDELAKHPWSLKGGGATKLKAQLEVHAGQRLGQMVDEIGFASFPGTDDAFVFANRRATAVGCSYARPFVTGEAVRDWSLSPTEEAIAPYDAAFQPIPEAGLSPTERRHFWSVREVVLSTTSFGGRTRKQNGEQPWTWYRWQPTRYAAPFRITFAFVTTHNHFVLDRGGTVFKQSAPIIKLPPDATEEDHLALLGYLNSSTACFWMKQVFFDKGNRGEGGGTTAEAWERFYEFDGTKAKQFPLPHGWRRGVHLELSRRLDELGRAWADHQLNPDHVSTFLGLSGKPLSECLNLHEDRKRELEDQIRWLQEELDWVAYRDWGLCSPDLALSQLPDEMPRLRPGARPSDARFAQQVVDGAIGERYFTLCRLPEPAAVAIQNLDDRQQRRFDAAATRPLSMLEVPEFKRTYRESFRPTKVGQVLATWLVQRVEREIRAVGTPRSVRQLARTLSRDPKVLAVAEVRADRSDPDLEQLLTELVKADAVPYLAAHRYKEKGVEKYRLWQQTWDAQRAEDAWEASPVATRGPRPAVPLPPKYAAGDFARPEYKKLRGKLDVPKERFISYPGVQADEDPTPLLGWAGWDHAARMDALGALVEAEGDSAKLVPLLAGMQELLPWVQQWHGDDDRYGTPLGELWRGHLEGLMATHELTPEKLRAWRPPKKTRRRRKKGGTS